MGHLTVESCGLSYNKISHAVWQTSASNVAYINGVSEVIFKVGMCLPAGPYVSDEDVRYIVETIKSAIV